MNKVISVAGKFSVHTVYTFKISNWLVTHAMMSLLNIFDYPIICQRLIPVVDSDVDCAIVLGFGGISGAVHKRMSAPLTFVLTE